MKKKLKVYLDTNIIYGFIKSIVETLNEGRDYRENWKIKFIEHNLDCIEPITSYFTFLEVAKNLRKDYELDSEKILKVIEFFQSFTHIHTIEDVELTGNMLEYFLNGIQLRDSMQLEMAKNENCFLVTEDKKLLEIGVGFYSKILSYRNLEELVRKTKRSFFFPGLF